MAANTVKTTAKKTLVISTYEQLWGEFEKHLTEEGKGGATIRNHRCSYSNFLKDLDIGEGERIGKEFLEDLEANLEKHTTKLKKLGTKAKRANERASHIRRIQKFYLARVPFKGKIMTFSAALMAIIAKLNLNIASFYELYVIDLVSIRVFSAWCRGKWLPTYKHIEDIEKIESNLNKKGLNQEIDLCQSLPKRLYGRPSRPRGQTSYGRKMQIASMKENRYGVWVDHLDEEFKAYEKFKSSDFTEEGKNRARNAIWTSSPGCHLPTAKKIKEALHRFFGYCHQPPDAEPFVRGLGISLEELTLALITDKRINEGYIEFQKMRAGGKYNAGTIEFLRLGLSLLRADTGYLFQHPEFAEKVGKKMTPLEWQALCLGTRARLKSIMEDVETYKKEAPAYYEKGRDPSEPIQNILNKERPLYAIIEMLEDMWRDFFLLDGFIQEQAEHCRNLLLIALLAANPLRIRQFAIMEFDRHLIRDEKGQWWLCFKKGEFKNRKSLKSDYQVRVAPELWQLIELYRTKYRIHLAGAETCSYVFRPSKSLPREGHNDYMETGSLSKIVEDMTWLYMLNSPGFGPHAFRHIIATDIIKRDPRLGFFLAARALHDKLETVEEEYQHLTTQEFFEPYNDLYCAAWRRGLSSTIREAINQIGKAA